MLIVNVGSCVFDAKLVMLKINEFETTVLACITSAGRSSYISNTIVSFATVFRRTLVNQRGYCGMSAESRNSLITADVRY
jgi:hypothetical protein